MKDPVVRGLFLSTASLLVWNLGWVVGGRVLARCWVLKDQAGWVRPVGGGSGGVSLWASFAAAARVCVVVVLVGLLFEICIVDASILR
jgi:hypothetical protein